MSGITTRIAAVMTFIAVSAASAQAEPAENQDIERIKNELAAAICETEYSSIYNGSGSGKSFDKSNTANGAGVTGENEVITNPYLKLSNIAYTMERSFWEKKCLSPEVQDILKAPIYLCFNDAGKISCLPQNVYYQSPPSHIGENNPTEPQKERTPRLIFVEQPPQFLR